MDYLLILCVEDYLSGELPLERLQRVVIDMVWGDQKIAPVTLDLAKQIQLCIAEFTGKHINEAALKKEIRGVAGIKPFVVRVSAASSRRSSSRWASGAKTQIQTVAYA